MRPVERTRSAHPRARPPARLRHEPRGRDPRRQQDRARADRRRHRGRRRLGQRCADRLPALLSTEAAAQLPRAQLRCAHRAVLRSATARFQAGDACGRRAAHGLVDGRALRADGEDLGHHTRSAGSAGIRKSHESRGGLAGGLLRRSRRRLRRARDRQQYPRRHFTREAREAATIVRSQCRGHAHGWSERRIFATSRRSPAR